MNSVIIIGRLTRNPEIKQLNSGQILAKFTVAVDKGLSAEKKRELEAEGKPTADFIPCQAWGKVAENLERFTQKGNRVAVNGNWQTGSYVDNDGKTVYTHTLNAFRVEFIDFKEKEEQESFVNDFEEFEELDVIDDGRLPF